MIHRSLLAAALGTFVIVTAGVARAEPPGLPEVISAPTGDLLAAGVLYSRSSVSTDGANSWDARIGLGNVAEFGVASSTLVERAAIARPVRHPTAKLGIPAGRGPGERVSFASASFRLGIAAERLFAGQPALALGFRKSFVEQSDDHATRFASLHLAATRRLGRAATVHLGVVMWDVGITRDGAPPFALHDRGLQDQVRGFGGIELRARRATALAVDLTWEPTLCPGCAGNQAELAPILSWGLRHDLSDWLSVQSGIRVSDPTAADLLDVDVYGQLSFASRLLGR